MPLSRKILPHGSTRIVNIVSGSGINHYTTGATLGDNDILTGSLAPDGFNGVWTVDLSGLSGGGGGGSGIVASSSQWQLPYYKNSGVSATLSGTSAMTYDSSSEKLVLTSTQAGNASLQLKNTQAASTASGLEIYNQSSQVFQIGHNNNTDENYVWGTGDIPLKFATSGTERMRISATGNIGIGETTPVRKLDVNSAGIDIVSRFTSTDNRATIQLSDDDTNRYINTENSAISLGPNSSLHSNNLNIVGSPADVGIGTTSPDAKLEVLATGAQLRLTHTDASKFMTTAVDTNGSTTFTNQKSYRFIGEQTDGVFQIDQNSIALNRDTDSAASALLKLGDHTTYDQFSILEDQRGSTATNGLLYLRTKKTGTAGYATVALGAISGSNTSYLYVNGISTNEALRFDTNSKSHAFDIAKAGYVSVGGAVDSTNQFTVIGNTHLSGTTNLKDHLLMENDKYIKFYQNGGSTYHTSIGYNTSNELQLGGLYGIHLRTYSGGWGNRVTVASDGDVGIGTVSPASKLHVAASGNIANGIVVGTAGNSGLYEYNAAQMRVAVGGVDKLRITTEGCQFGSDGSWSPSVRVGTGSANAPSATNIAFRPLQDDTDTGYSRSADDTLALVSSGTQMMTINPTGVGIGTTAPGFPLVVSGTQYDMAKIISSHSAGTCLYLDADATGGSNWHLQSTADGAGTGGGKLDFVDNGTSRMVIDSAGKVGIGTTSPDYDLDVSSTAPRISLTDTNGVQYYFMSQSNHFYLHDQSNNETRLFIKDSTGDIGIGTVSPSAKLEVSGAIALTSGSVTSAPGYKSLWASGSNLYWGTEKLETSADGTIGGTVGAGYIPYASSTDTLANFALAYTEGANIIMGNKPDSMTSDADNNTGFGYNVFNKYTTSDDSTAFGAYALVEASGANVYRNTAIGQGAAQYGGQDGSTFRDNVAVGASTLTAMCTGSYNVAIGNYAMGDANWKNAEGNIAIGWYAAFDGGDGNDNITIGRQAVGMNTSSVTNWARNISMGYQTAYSGSEYGMSDNVFIGHKTAYGASNAYYNVIIGREAGHNLGGTQASVMLGRLAGYQYQGNRLVAIGDKAVSGSSGGDRSVAVGYEAAYNGIGNYGVVIGAHAGASGGTGENVIIGYRAGEKGGSNNNKNVAIGMEALKMGSAGEQAVAVGYLAASGGIGNYSVAIGSEAGRNASGSANSVIIGRQAMGAAAADGNNNVAVGYQAGYNATTGNGNVFVGAGAGREATTAQKNVVIGNNAGYPLGTHNASVIIGFEAGRYMEAGSGGNAILGYQAMYQGTQNYQNTAIGIGAGYKVTGASSNNVYIGSYAGPSSASAESNKLYINNAEGTPLIGGDFSADEIYLNGDVGIGTSGPDRELHVHKSSTSVGFKLSNDSTGQGSADGFYIDMGATDAEINNKETGKIAFATANSTRMTIDSAGNLNIGNTTTIGDGKLTVKEASNPQLSLAYDGSNYNTLRTKGDGALEIKRNGTAAANRIALLSGTNILLGQYAGYDIASTQTGETVIIGDRAGQELKGNETHGRHTIIGAQSTMTMSGTTDSDYVVAIGAYSAGYAQPTKGFTAIGTFAGYYLSGSGDGPLLIGGGAGKGSAFPAWGTSNGVTMSEDVLIGHGGVAEYAETLSQNTIVGSRAAGYLRTGTQNVAVGRFALRNASGSNGVTGNVTIGQSAGSGIGQFNKTNGSRYNIAIGYETQEKNLVGDRNIAIGYKVGIDGASTVDDILRIGNAAGDWSFIRGDMANDNFWIGAGTPKFTLSGGKVGIGTIAPSYKLDVRGGAMVKNSASHQTLELRGDTGYGAYINYVRNNGSWAFRTGMITNASRWDITDYQGAGYEALSVLSDLKVGINETSPPSTLGIDGAVSIKERADHETVTADYGQIWVKNTTPNTLYFTDDAGTDHQLGAGGGSSVSFGSDNQIPYTNSGGDDFDYSANLTFDGTDLFLDTSGGGKLKLGAATEYIQGSGSDIRIHASDHVLIDAEDQVTIRASDFAWETDGGSEKMRFKADTGRLGIGTNAPDQFLHVKGGTTDQVLKLESTDGNVDATFTDSAGSGIIRFTDDRFEFYTDSGYSNNPINFWDARVGIGTQVPTQPLDVVTGDGVVIRRENTDSAIYGPSLYIDRKRATGGDLSSGDLIGNITFRPFETDYDNRAATISAAIEGTVTTDTTPGRLMFSTAAAGANTVTERMRIDSTGKVGIGTSSPTEFVHIKHASTNSLLLLESGDNIASLRIKDPSSTQFINSDGGYLSMGTNSSLNAGNLNVSGDGWTGVGTVAPKSKLHVSGGSFQKAVHTATYVYDIAAGFVEAAILEPNTGNFIMVAPAPGQPAAGATIPTYLPDSSADTVGLELTIINNTAANPGAALAVQPAVGSSDSIYEGGSNSASATVSIAANRGANKTFINVATNVWVVKD